MTWPRTQLREVLREDNHSVEVVPDAEYPIAGLYGFGRGLFERGTILGAQTAYSEFYRLREGAFVLSRVKAWEGAVGVVPASLNGRYVSKEFPSFVGDPERIDTRFLKFFFDSDQGRRALASCTKGIGARRERVKEEAFLNIEIPLPNLSTQRMIADRYDTLRRQLEEAASLAAVGVRAAARLVQSVIAQEWRVEEAWPKSRFDAVVRLVSGQVDPRVERYADMPHINGEAIEAGTGRLLNYRTARDDGVMSGKYAFKSGAVLYSKIRPYLMKATVVPETGVCSADVYATEWIDESLIPEFLVYSLLSPRFTAYANGLSGRTRMPKLNQGQLFSYELGIPPRPVQCAIVERVLLAASQQADMLRLLKQRSQALEALMPSVLRASFDQGGSTNPMTI
jgi:type I restriction enzyme, S subunit